LLQSVRCSIDCAGSHFVAAGVSAATFRNRDGCGQRAPLSQRLNENLRSRCDWDRRESKAGIPANKSHAKDLNEVAASLRAEYGPRLSEVVNETARLYAVRFSEQELKDALAFYKSPVGRKLIAEEPGIAEQSLKWTSAWADKLSEEIVAKMRAEMKKRGHEI
jgi:hypothetical protein